MKRKKLLGTVILTVILVLTMSLNVQAASKIPAPQIGNAKSVNSKSIKITWKKCKNVSGYVVYRNNKRLAVIKGSNKNTYTDKKIQSGKSYKYSVKAYRQYKKKRVYSAKSKTVTGKAMAGKNSSGLGTPELTAIRFFRSGAPYADGVEYGTTWKKIKGADGYQVESKEYGWKTASAYKAIKKTKGTSASIQFSDIYKFGFRVRAYKIVNGKTVYGPYSKWVWKQMYY